MYEPERAARVYRHRGIRLIGSASAVSFFGGLALFIFWNDAPEGFPAVIGSYMIAASMPLFVSWVLAKLTGWFFRKPSAASASNAVPQS
jgi:hypothetical protein